MTANEEKKDPLLTELIEIADWLDSDLRACQVADDETPLGFTQIDADTIRARIAGVKKAINVSKKS